MNPPNLTPVTGRRTIMELLFISVSLTLGVVLIFFGIHGLPTGLQLSRSLPAFGPLPGPMAEPLPLPTRLTRPQPKQTMPQPDLLLADLMTEMIAIRAEIAELREKVEAVQPAPRKTATRQRRTTKAS